MFHGCHLLGEAGWRMMKSYKNLTVRKNIISTMFITVRPAVCLQLFLILTQVLCSETIRFRLCVSFPKSNSLNPGIKIVMTFKCWRIMFTKTDCLTSLEPYLDWNTCSKVAGGQKRWTGRSNLRGFNLSQNIEKFYKFHTVEILRCS